MRPIAVRYRHTPATLPDAIGIGPLNMVVVSEIFPFRLRAVAMSLALFLNRLVSGAVASSFLSLTEMLSAEGLRLPAPSSPHSPRTSPCNVPAPLPAPSPPCTSAHRRIAAALHLRPTSQDLGTSAPPHRHLPPLRGHRIPLVALRAATGARDARPLARGDGGLLRAAGRRAVPAHPSSQRARGGQHQQPSGSEVTAGIGVKMNY